MNDKQEYKIVSNKDTIRLEEEMSKYDISSLGSLTIHNGHYFQSFIGSTRQQPKHTKPVLPKVPKETEVPKEIVPPKVASKSKKSKK